MCPNLTESLCHEGGPPPAACGGHPPPSGEGYPHPLRHQLPAPSRARWGRKLMPKRMGVSLPRRGRVAAAGGRGGATLMAETLGEVRTHYRPGFSIAMIFRPPPPAASRRDPPLAGEGCAAARLERSGMRDWA